MAELVPFNRNIMSFRPTGFVEFYNMLDDFFTDTRSPRRSLSTDTFKVDVQENEKEYYIEAELPGVKKDEINLELNEGKLTISVNREENSEQVTKTYIHRERRYSSMQRAIYLKDAKIDNIKARLEEGVLNITVPKQAQIENKLKIDIE